MGHNSIELGEVKRSSKEATEPLLPIGSLYLLEVFTIIRDKCVDQIGGHLRE
jgi:hypothetical protein